MQQSFLKIATALGMLGMWSGLLQAGEPGCENCENRLARAGYPNCVAPWARGPNGAHEIGYYVGGGARSRHGHLRRCDEGVWGVDAQPIVPGFRQAVVLKWWNGRAYQGGAGAYEPDHKNQPFENAHENHERAHGESVGH